MQIRNHAEMKWRGEPNWPPHWGGTYERGAVRPQGEDGVLEGIEVGGPDLKSSRSLSLTMRYRDANYHAILHFDNPDFMPRLFARLRTCKGLSLRQVGDIEIE